MELRENIQNEKQRNNFNIINVIKSREIITYSKENKGKKGMCVAEKELVCVGNVKGRNQIVKTILEKAFCHCFK